VLGWTPLAMGRLAAASPLATRMVLAAAIQSVVQGEAGREAVELLVCVAEGRRAGAGLTWQRAGRARIGVSRPEVVKLTIAYAVSALAGLALTRLALKRCVWWRTSRPGPTRGCGGRMSARKLGRTASAFQVTAAAILATAQAGWVDVALPLALVCNTFGQRAQVRASPGQERRATWLGLTRGGRARWRRRCCGRGEGGSGRPRRA
jgi:hypothetical protein